MRCRFLVFSFLFSLIWSATVAQARASTALRISVVDPQDAVVVGARVTLMQGARVVEVQTTSAEGVAVFAASGDGVQVFAPGFAPASAALAQSGEASTRVKLAVAAAPQTVVASAVLTPVAQEETGTAVAALGRGDLLAMQPLGLNEALRFLPGAVVSTAGQRGGQASLFARGGESRYNKVIVDGVPINNDDGFFDFGVIPPQELERVELLRGPQSTLYGSDAMSSVVQLWSATGLTRTPELRFGADGGNFATAHGYASLAGARGRFDYDLFGDQVNTDGDGVNAAYSNSSEGANVGVAISPRMLWRTRVRHLNSRAGAQNAWKFNGVPLLPPDSDQVARQNSLIASTELAINGPGPWQHRLTGYEYSHRLANVDLVPDRGCDFAQFIFRDCPFDSRINLNRAGVDYQGEYTPRGWSRTTFGYGFEDEHGDTRSLLSGAVASGLRRNHALYVEHLFLLPRGSLTAGARYVHNESFGSKGVPRVAGTYLARRGKERIGGTRLRGAFATGIKAPSFLESFGEPAFSIIPNPNLKPEENRSLEAGVEQSLAAGRVAVTALYFNDLFHNRIDFQSLGPPAFQARFININKVLSHGAEFEAHARLRPSLSLNAAYDYTATQTLEAPLAPSTIGKPLLRRPKHLGSLLLVYSGRRWGGNLGGSFVGRRPDNDFQGFGIDHAAGYARADFGGWFAVSRYATAYFNVENALNRNYNEVLGFPAIGASFRAGMRFRVGGE